MRRAAISSAVTCSPLAPYDAGACCAERPMLGVVGRSGFFVASPSGLGPVGRGGASAGRTFGLLALGGAAGFGGVGFGAGEPPKMDEKSLMPDGRGAGFLMGAGAAGLPDAADAEAPAPPNGPGSDERGRAGSLCTSPALSSPALRGSCSGPEAAAAGLAFLPAPAAGSGRSPSALRLLGCGAALPPARRALSFLARDAVDGPASSSSLSASSMKSGSGALRPRRPFVATMTSSLSLSS
jgi:hypothetical protein